MKLNVNKKYLASLILGACLLLAPAPYKIISYVVLILCIAAVIPLGKTFGYLTRTVLGFLLVTCVHQVFGIIFWALGLGFTLELSLLPFYILLIAMTLWNKPRLKPSFACTKNEILALLFSIVCVGVIGATTFRGGPASQQSIRYISRGFDNSTHYSMVLSDYKNHGYVYGTNEGTKGKILLEFSAYPQGWHLTNSLIWHGLLDNFNSANVSKFLFTYVLTTLAWYLALLFLVTNLTISLARQITKKPLGNIEFIAVFGGITLLQLTALVGLLSSGFSNYIALLAYIMATLLLALEVTQGNIRSRSYVLLASLLAAGMSFTWLLAAPVGYILVIAPFLKANKPVATFFNFVKDNKLVCLVSLFLLAIGGTQALIQLKYGSGLEHLNALGVAWPLNKYLLPGLFAASIIALFSSSIPKSVQQFIQIIFASSAVLVGAIYMYQYQAIASVSYYSEKMTMALVVVMSIIACALLASSMRRLVKQSGELYSLFILGGILVAIPVMFSIDTSTSRYVLGYRELSSSTALKIADLIYEKQAFHNNVIVMKDLSQFEDVSTTHTIDMLSDTVVPNKCSIALNNALFLGDIHPRIDAVKLCANIYPKRNYYVLTSSKNHDDTQKLFGNLPNVKVILSN